MKLLKDYMEDIAWSVLNPLGMFNTYSGIYPHTIGNIFKDNSAWKEICKLDVVSHMNTVEKQETALVDNTTSTSKTTYALYYTEEKDGQSASWWVDYNS